MAHTEPHGTMRGDTPRDTPSRSEGVNDDPPAEHPQEARARRSNQPANVERARQEAPHRGGKMLNRKITKNTKTGLYEYVFELDPTYTADGKKVRNRKVVRRKNKTALIEEVKRLEVELNTFGELVTGTLTVQQWFARWIEDMEKELRPNTMTNYRSVVKQHIVPGLGPGTKLDKLTADKVRNVYKQMAAKGASSTYMLNAHRVMSSAFNDAVRERKLLVNPTSLVKAPRAATINLDVLTADESIRLLGYVSELPDGARWATALLTGARRGEVIGLEQERVGDFLDLSWQMQRLTYAHRCKTPCGGKRGADCPDRYFRFPVDYEARPISGGLHLVRPKSSTGWRIVPLVDPLRTILHRYMSTAPASPHGLVFTHSDGRPLDPDQDTRAWNKVLQDAFPGRRVRLHDLRHAAVDLLYEAGVPEDLVSEIVGHSTRAMTRAYKAKGNQKRLTAAMAQMSELFTPHRTAASLPADSGEGHMNEIVA